MQRSLWRGSLAILFGMFVALGLIGVGATAGTAGAAGPTGFGAQVTATAWTSTNPPSIPSTNSYDNTVSCVSSSFCVATVFQETSPSVNVLVQIWDGSTWTTQSVPGRPVRRTRLFCPCRAPRRPSASRSVPRSQGIPVRTPCRCAIMWNGSSWSMSRRVERAFRVQRYRVGRRLVHRACVVHGGRLGRRTPRTSVNQTLAEQWDGATWSLLFDAVRPRSPTPTAFLAVSCTATDAIAWPSGPVRRTTGAFVLPNTESFGFRARARAPRPSDSSSPDSQAGGGVNAHDVPHAPPPDIEAPRRTVERDVMEPSARPPPRPDATDPEFVGVSCAGIGFCMADGVHLRVTSVSAFSEEWSNGTWSEVPVPLPPAGGRSWRQSAASARRPARLRAKPRSSSRRLNRPGGTYVSGSWNGADWTLTPVAAPAGATAAAWTGVSCLTGGSCVVAGGLATGLDFE